MKSRRYCFTLIETLVAFSLLAIVLGAVVLGITRSVRATQLQTSKERLDRMLLQAFRFSSISGHVGDVVLCLSEDGNGEWEGYVNLWEMDARTLSLLAQQCKAIGHLPGITTLQLNGRKVHKAIFRFFGGHGLSAVYAFDEYGSELTPSDFGFSSEVFTHSQRELEITLQPTRESTGETLSLKKYILSTPHYLQFPDEYLSTHP